MNALRVPIMNDEEVRFGKSINSQSRKVIRAEAFSLPLFSFASLKSMRLGERHFPFGSESACSKSRTRSAATTKKESLGTADVASKPKNPSVEPNSGWKFTPQATPRGDG